MKHKTRPSLLYIIIIVTIILLAYATSATQGHESVEELSFVRPLKVAIIGGGIGGTSAAYFIKQKFNDNNPHNRDIELFIYERNNHLGGRVNHVEIDGIQVELGASVYHRVNTHMRQWVKQFNLHEDPVASEGHFGIWDGQSFRFQSSTYKLLTGLKVVYRYGRTPFTVDAIAADVRDKFVALYPFLTNSTFETPADLLAATGLDKYTEITLREELEQQGVAYNLFLEEVVEGSTRVNYGQSIHMSALPGYVSIVGSSDLFSVREGNRRVAENLAAEAGAAVRLLTQVVAVETASQASEGRYVVRSKNNANPSIELEESFDAVVIATPLEFADIALAALQSADDLPSTNVVPDRAYQATFVTLVSGTLDATYFGFSSTAEELPSMILTTESHKPWTSIGLRNRTGHNRGVWKIFSRHEITEDTLDQLFKQRVKEATFRHKWFAYPVYTSPVPMSEYPAFRLNSRASKEQVYYINAFESAVSTMETQTVAACNVANLLVADLI